MYHVKSLRNHIEYGDAADDRHGEILPHPYCDFCEEFLFNDLGFFDHLSQTHLTCHLCGDHHKNLYYKEYANLESHFAQTHHICPYEICKAKCYVAFKTEDELRTHLDIEHNLAGSGSNKPGKIKANALLGFAAASQEEVEAAWEDKKAEERDTGRGRGGRGRGGRGGRGGRETGGDRV